MLRSEVRFLLAPPEKSWSERVRSDRGGAGIDSIEHLSNIPDTPGRTIGSVSIHVRDTAKGRRYDVKLRGQDGRQHSKTFATKRAATDWQARQLAALGDGHFIAPRAGETTLLELSERWQQAGAKRESTRTRDRSIIAKHVLPGLGADRALATVSRADCQALVDRWRTAGAAPRTIARQRATLRSLFQLAVDADLIARNPAVGLKLPLPARVHRPDLSGDELEGLAEALGADQAAFMWCGAVLGLRWAETAGLTVGSVDPVATTIAVTQQLDRHGHLATPKTSGSIRTLAAPAWLLDELAGVERRRTSGRRDGNSLLFVNSAGAPLSYPNWRQRVWQPATVRAGLIGLRYHDLRSVAASALVAAGVDLRTAMHRLGHTTPTMTLAVYARVATDRDRAAADAASARIAPGRRAKVLGTTVER
jgi:integrase